ncbi:MAG: hypothetical protein FWE05_08835 [Defluviitaleaceae bacterium]|nr:hypothetical protein [Defluviitaleaceae bacterium]
MALQSYQGHFEDGAFYSEGKKVTIPENKQVVITILEDSPTEENTTEDTPSKDTPSKDPSFEEMLLRLLLDDDDDDDEDGYKKATSNVALEGLNDTISFISRNRKDFL